VVVVAIRLISMFACTYGGFRIAEILNDNYILRNPQQALSIVVGIILGVLVGYVLGGVIGRYVARLLGLLDNSLYRISGIELFFGVMGGLVGLLAALIPSIALFRFGYPGDVAAIVFIILCGFLGGRIGILKRAELSSMLKLGPSTARAAAESKAAILDTSVIIDGRIVEIVKAGFIEGSMVVPRFVLEELQSIADSADELKRSRGRRGLDVLNALQRLDNASVEIIDQDFPEMTGVDGKLVALSKSTGMPLTTNDFNLNKVAELQGVRVMNINALASSLKPVVLAGEEMKVKIIREGKEPGQGVGYLDDGTMVVVEQGKQKLGSEVTVMATSILQTPAGKMIFSDLREELQGG
jgi:uncharacterized protein YacL